MTKEEIISRATLLSNKIRSRRAALINKPEVLLVYNNLIKSTIYLLKELHGAINNTERATLLLDQTEKEYNTYIW